MSKTKELIILIVFVLYGITDSVDIQCKYFTISFVSVNSVYSCYLQSPVNIKSKESAVFDSAIGSHSSNKTKSDVECFYSENSGHIVQYFPRNLENIFINLKSILIRHGRLQEIKQRNLQPFPKLMYLDLDQNDIDILEDELFAYNPELEYVCIKRNKLFHIGLHIFDNLHKLSWLYLESNPCINMKADSNQTDMNRVINHARVTCLGFSKIEKNLQELENSLVCVNSETLPIFDQKLQNLLNQFQNSTVSYYLPLKNRFEAISNLESKNIWSVKDKVVTMESSIVNSTSEILTEMNSLKNDLIAIRNGQTSSHDKLMKGVNESISQLISSRVEIISTISDNISKVNQTLNVISQEIKEVGNYLVNLSIDLKNSSQTAQRSLRHNIHITKNHINDKMFALDDSLSTKITKISDKMGKSINDRITALEINCNKAFKLKEENIIDEVRNSTVKNGFKYFMIGFCLILCIFNIVLIIAFNRFFISFVTPSLASS